MSDADTEVFRSAVRAQCHERAFVLAAVGITAAIDFNGEQYLLTVPHELLAQARAHLRSYELESIAPPPPPEPPRPHPYAARGCVVYVAVLVGVALAVANGWWRLDAFELGELDAGAVRHGQWWRAWTALTLHLDSAHLAANLGAGVWFGYLAAAQVGSGSAWLLIVTGAALANLLEGLLGPDTHRAVGASTAVFTALGLLAAHAWRTRLHIAQRWALRWAPLVAGAVLLGWFGSGGESPDGAGTDGGGTDIVAHALGFVVGCLLGVWVAMPAVARAVNRVPQWLMGAAALASIAIAWACALR